MSATFLIARDELRLMARNRVAVIAFALLVLLTLTAVASAWSHQRHTEELRARHQSAAEQAFDAPTGIPTASFTMVTSSIGR